MAFAFVVETGAGLDNATSYVSVAEADDYFTPDTFFATWDPLTQTQKEHALAWASRLLDQKCEYAGTIASEEQALRWPRKGARNKDGIVVSSGIVPKPIKDAACELAKFLLNGADLTTGTDVDNLLRVKVDVIEIEFQEDTAQVSTPSIINSILRPIGFFRMGGWGSAKIVKAG